MTGAPEPRQKAVWPLWTVAALSFIPFLGIFFGCAGATWGFVSKRRHAMRAGLLAMAGALVQIVGSIVWLTVPTSTGAMAESHADVVRTEIKQVVDAIDQYHTDLHEYPPTLAELRAHRGILKPLSTADHSQRFMSLKDLQYRVSDDGKSFDLFGVGPDGIPGTADDIRPVLPDSVLARSGYRPQAKEAKP